MAWAAFRVHEVYRRHGVKDLWITSGDDGDHGRRGVPDEIDPTTWHGKGRAHDFRTHNIPAGKLDKIVADIKRRLSAPYQPAGVRFDVVLEGRGLPWEHIHVEADEA
jgi:hypothetical protein